MANNHNEIYDLVIIGGGAAGFAAGLYAARARLRTILLERLGYGGQLLTYERVDNYPGFPEGISAFGLVELFTAQAFRFGLESRSAEVVGIESGDLHKTVHLAEGQILAKSLVIATGAAPNKLGIKGESELTGKGVSYCAVCDAPFFREQDVAVIGGGDTAVEEAIYLTRFARKVYLIHRRDSLRAVQVVQEQALQNPKIEFIWNTVPTEIQGGVQGVETLLLTNTQTHQTSPLKVNGVFVFIGIQPNTGFLSGDLKLDRLGFIVTDQEMATSMEGVFAAGDVRSKNLRQIVTAVGEGAIAATSAGRYLESHV
jgi:thioredoxin reductase (NADPH)